MLNKIPKTGLTCKGKNQNIKSIAGNKGRGASIVVDWFAELGRDQEDLGSISATSKRFSGNQSLYSLFSVSAL